MEASVAEITQKYARVMGRSGSFSDRPNWTVIHPDQQKQIVAEMIDSGLKHGNKNVILNEMIRRNMAEKGGLKYASFASHRTNPAKPIIMEMIDTAQGQMALLEKVRIDVAFGLADIPLLYGPIYHRIAPSGGFPGGTYQIDDFTMQANVVFLQKFEGGEVQFGTLQTGSPQLGAIQTYAAGFEWTEDMIEFDKTWSVELNSQAFGRAYNALLNHLHLSAIIGYSYPGGNVTNAVTSGSTDQENTHLTFQAAYTSTVTATPRRTGTVLLASEADRFQIEESILTPVFDANGQPLANVPIDTIIYYDGETIQRGSDQFVYPGVTAGTCFLIFPKRKMKELVHHDLRIDIGPADISRLVEGQQVGRSRRGVFAAIEESVQKIVLP